LASLCATAADQAVNPLNEYRLPMMHEGGVMKILIKKTACVGNARCAAVSEELFPLDDVGYISVEQVDVPPGKEDLARRGARACPERIIRVEE
jgi:ferredoxin